MRSACFFRKEFLPIFAAVLFSPLLAAGPGSRAASSAPPPSAPDKAGLVWVRIPGGEFTMGSADGSGDEKPPHQVQVRDFFLAKTVVTQAQWRAIMGTDPSAVKGCDDCPVTNVSWHDAQAFLEKAGKVIGERLRLPTEAEWEYAAGGGAEHQTWAGASNNSEALAYGWFSINSARKLQPVCKKLPNLFGLCDMSGGVWEWCADWYDKSYYGESPQANPAGPAAGENRVLRGGCWASTLPVSRVTQRYSSWPGAQTPYNGFRPARD